MRRLAPLIIALCAATLLTACGGSGGSHPQVEIVQTDNGCTPVELTLAPNKTVTLVVHNQGQKDHEVEGINGTKLQELLVPAGKTRQVNFTPSGKGDQIKCYIPGGSTTVIQIKPQQG